MRTYSWTVLTKVTMILLWWIIRDLLSEIAIQHLEHPTHHRILIRHVHAHQHLPHHHILAQSPSVSPQRSRSRSYSRGRSRGRSRGSGHGHGRGRGRGRGRGCGRGRNGRATASRGDTTDEDEEQWSKNATDIMVNEFTESVGPTFPLSSEPVDVFLNLFPPHIIDIIVTETNRYAAECL